MPQDFKPVTIAIMGGSASGKTTFAQALVERFTDITSVFLHLDTYFQDWAE